MEDGDSGFSVVFPPDEDGGVRASVAIEVALDDERIETIRVAEFPERGLTR